MTFGTWNESVIPVRDAETAHLDIARLVEAVHLVKEFQQDTLNLSVSTCLGIETFRGDGIDLINEDDGR